METKLESDRIVLLDGQTQAGEIVWKDEIPGVLTVVHTGVEDSYRGQGLGAQLVEAVVDYARKENKKIIPICPFIRSEFESHPEKYSDVWQKA